MKLGSSLQCHALVLTARKDRARTVGNQVVSDSAQRVLKEPRALAGAARGVRRRVTIRARGFYEVIVACFLL